MIPNHPNLMTLLYVKLVSSTEAAAPKVYAELMVALLFSDYRIEVVISYDDHIYTFAVQIICALLVSEFEFHFI